MKTSTKILIASIVSKLLIFILKKKRHIITRDKLIWNLDLNEAVDLSIFLTGKFEPQIVQTIKKISKDKKYDYIDIGANCGAHSLHLAKEFPNSRVLAIEPTNYSFAKLTNNIDLNKNLKNIIIPIQMFITSKKIKPDSVYSSWELNTKKIKHQNHLGIKENLENANLDTLDNIVRVYDIKNSVIKCDVDGNELYVFQSGIDYLQKFKPKIVMELAPYLYEEHGYKSSELFNFFKSLGYKFYEVSSHKEINFIQEFSDKISVGSSKNIFLI